MPTKLTADLVLDESLNYIKTNGNRVVLCEGAPSNFTNANTAKSSGGNQLGIATISGTNFTGPANGDVSGRKLTFNQLTNVTADEAGTVDHIAIINTTGSELLVITPEDQENGGTAQAGASTTITLASGASANDDQYNGMTVEILSGTGAGQIRTISDYVGSTKVATVNAAWSTNPDSTSVYTVYGRGVSASDAVTIGAFDLEIADPT